MFGEQELAPGWLDKLSDAVNKHIGAKTQGVETIYLLELIESAKTVERLGLSCCVKNARENTKLKSLLRDHVFAFDDDYLRWFCKECGGKTVGKEFRGLEHRPGCVIEEIFGC